MVVQCLGVFVVTVIVAAVLSMIPGLRYGWFHLVYAGGGNVGLTPITALADASTAAVRVGAGLFLLVLLAALPILAHSEERVFRAGVLAWRAILQRSVLFGLMHCVVGVPLAAGIALTVPGVFLGYHYKRTYERLAAQRGWYAEAHAADEALLTSTAYHTMYNAIIVSLLGLLMWT